jgi:uncharacterized repeat protein (TIGR01451 family)
MQRIVDETFRRGRLATQFVAGAFLLALASACGTDSAVAPTPPRAVAEPQDALRLLELSAAFDAYAFAPLTKDDGGANDYSGQNDLNVFTRADNVTGYLGVAWTWDDINAWEGTGQTGDACALFDTDPVGTAASAGGGKADYAVCVRINNPGAGAPPTQLPIPESPLVYQCGDSKTDRCTTTYTVLPLGGTACEVYKSAENFPAGDDGFDALAGCRIDLSAIGNPSRTSLLNVCSFPSGSPNSNPFDCVVTPGSGFVQIKKKTSPQTSGQTFSFTLNPASSDNTTAFNILDNSANDEATALIPVAPGTFSVTESTFPSGWSLSTASCTGAGTNGSQVGNAVTGIVVGVGQTAVCTFENAQSGSITIVKDALPNDQQDFTFTGNITGCTSFTLDDDAGATGESTTNSNQKVCPVGAGTYNVDEAVPSGWVKTSATCSDGSPITAIAVAAGESVTCTFTNTKNGSITIIKDAVPNDLENFAFAGNITGCASFTLDDDAGVTGADNTNLDQKVCSVAPGTYNVDETVPAGWAKTSATCSDNSPITAIVVSAGESITCTFQNTKDGTLKLVKKLSPTGDPGKFDLTIAGTTYQGAGNAGFGNDGTTGFVAVTLGSVTFSEGAHTGTNAADYTTALECRNASNQVVASNPNGTNTAGSVNVGAGDQITCTFTNTRTQGSIELKKIWSGTAGETTLRIGSTAGASDIASQLTSAGLTTGAKTVNTGTYYVSEIAISNYTSALACTDNGTSVTPSASNALAVGNGHTVVCTFTNTRQQGTIELKKVWSGTAGVTTLRIGTSANGSDVASQLTSAGLTTGVKTVNTGTYYVSETGGLADYNSALACTDDGNPVTPGADNALSVGFGHVVVCTFTNTRKTGSIKVDKVWVGPGGQTTLKIGTTAGGSETKSQVTGSAGAAPLTTGAQTVNTGTYYVAESGGLTDYTTDLVCTNGGSPITPGASNSVTVAEGSNIVCTFTNTRKPKLSITKTPDRDGTGYTVAPGGVATFSITVTNASDGGAANDVKIDDILPAGVGDWSDDQALCTVTALVGETEKRKLECNVGTLATNTSFTVIVTATIPANFLVKPATDNSAGLEIDGNLTRENSTAQDWATLGIDCTSTIKVGCSIDLSTGASDNSFGNGTKEDTPVPSIVSGQIPNNKSDLLRFYVANQRIVTTDHLYLAWERVQEPSGSTNMDFELNQSNQVHPNGLPVRSEGDVLITYDLAQGGAVANLGFHRWILTGTCGGNGSKAPCWGPRNELTEDPAQNFAGTINGGVVTDPIAPDAGRSLSVRTFGEARINLKDSGIFVEGICTVFGKAYLKSRSSDSFSAAVKDFITPVPINVSNCEDKELKNKAQARASNFAPTGGSLNDWFSDSGWVLITDEPPPPPPAFLTQSTVQETAKVQISAKFLRSKEVGTEEN